MFIIHLVLSYLIMVISVMHTWSIQDFIFNKRRFYVYDCLLFLFVFIILISSLVHFRKENIQVSLKAKKTCKRNLRHFYWRRMKSVECTCMQEARSLNTTILFHFEIYRRRNNVFCKMTKLVDDENVHCDWFPELRDR